MARPGLIGHRKFKRLSSALDGTIQAGFGDILARGVLEALWEPSWESGDDYLGDATDVEARIGWKGKRGAVAEMLNTAGGMDAGFIEEGGTEFWPEGRPGTYRIHDLYENAPDYVKRRLAKESARKASGKTISAIRSQAGKLGAEARWGQTKASDKQTDGSGMATGWQPEPVALANGPTTPFPTATPTATPTPTPSDAGSDFERLRREVSNRLAVIGPGGGGIPLPGSRNLSALIQSANKAIGACGLKACVDACVAKGEEMRAKGSPAETFGAFRWTLESLKAASPPGLREVVGLGPNGEAIYAEAKA